MADLLDRISHITRRDVLQGGRSELLQEGVPSGGVSLNGATPGRAPLKEVPLEQPVSPVGAPLEALPVEVSPLQQRGHSRLDVTGAVTGVGAPVERSLSGHNISNRLSSAYLTAIATDGALSELRRIGIYTTAALPDIALETYGAEYSVEYGYAATNAQSRLVGEKSEIIPNTCKETMTLPAKLEWKAVSCKELARLKKYNVYTLLPVISIPTGHKIISSRWVWKVKADNSRKARVVVLGWVQLPSVDCGSTFDPICRFQSIRMVLAVAVDYNLECWQLDYMPAFLNADVIEKVYVKMAPGYKEIR